MKSILVASLFLAATPAFPQTPANPSDTLQTLLAEVHQLRIDIEGMTAASQRVQIALYSLQMQDAAVARASQRFDSAHAKCAGLEQNQRRMTAEIQRVDTALASGTVAENLTKEVQSQQRQAKLMLESVTAELQSCQATESEASSSLRAEQAKLADLQDRIDRLDKALAKLSTGQ